MPASRNDQAAQVYVIFPRWPSLATSDVIGYVWDTQAPIGTALGALLGVAGFVLYINRFQIAPEEVQIRLDAFLKLRLPWRSRRMRQKRWMRMR